MITSLNAFLETIAPEENKTAFKDLLDWVSGEFQQLKLEFKWNQPMFTDHGTFIIGFSAAKNHIAAAPERACMVRFEKELKERHIDCTKELMRLSWGKPIDFDLLKMMIVFNMEDKADCEGFWRK